MEKLLIALFATSINVIAQDIPHVTLKTAGPGVCGQASLQLDTAKLMSNFPDSIGVLLYAGWYAPGITDNELFGIEYKGRALLTPDTSTLTVKFDNPRTRFGFGSGEYRVYVIRLVRNAQGHMVATGTIDPMDALTVTILHNRVPCKGVIESRYAPLNLYIGFRATPAEKAIALGVLGLAAAGTVGGLVVTKPRWEQHVPGGVVRKFPGWFSEKEQMRREFPKTLSKEERVKRRNVR